MEALCAVSTARCKVLQRYLTSESSQRAPEEEMAPPPRTALEVVSTLDWVRYGSRSATRADGCNRVHLVILSGSKSKYAAFQAV